MNNCAVTAALNRYMEQLDAEEAEAAALEDMQQQIEGEITADPEYLLEAITEWSDASQIAGLLARLVSDKTKMVDLPAVAVSLRGLVDDAISDYAAELAPGRLEDAAEAAEEAAAESAAEDAAYWLEVRHG